jgi:hypothetical protein
MHPVLLGKSEEADHLEDLGVDGRIMLKWIIGNMGRRVWIGFMWLRIRTSSDCHGQHTEPSGSINDGDFLN